MRLVRSLALLLFGVSLMNTSAARAEIPVLSSFINPCTRSAMLLHCKDGRGGYYGVAQWGNDMFLRGHDGGSGLSWAQTNTRFGRVQFFSGVSSDGNVWVGRTRLIGWNAISRFSTSSGDQGRISCNRLKGCD